MANLSDCYGEVEVKTTMDLKKFWTIIKDTQEIGEYSFALNLEDEDDYSYSELGFSGTGRNAFICNLTYFGIWAKIALIELGKKEELKDLEKNYFKLAFSYLDCERGNQMLEQRDVELIHEANTPLTDTKLVEQGYTSYEFTKENLVRCEFEYLADEL